MLQRCVKHEMFGLEVQQSCDAHEFVSLEAKELREQVTGGLEIYLESG